MDRNEKARLKREARETPSSSGIYAIRCTPTSECWVDHTPDLRAIQNRIWFSLRMGRHENRVLLDRYKTHGVDALAFEVLETFEPDLLPGALRTVRKERRQHWLDELRATRVYP